MKKIHVVGAIIYREDKILCVQRSEKMTLSGMWEFPGGKIEEGESPEEALAREILEELDCTIEVEGFVARGVYEYSFGEVTLDGYMCKLVEGEPKLLEHSDGKWLSRGELSGLEWAPADIPIVAKLN